MRYKKGAVRPGRGARCLICGMECGKGGSLKVHIEARHKVTYDAYKRCFKTGEFVVDEHKVDVGGDFLVHTRVLRFPKR